MGSIGRKRRTAGWMARVARVAPQTAACVLAATVVSLSPARAAQEGASQVPFAAYRDGRGLVVQQGGDRPPVTAADGTVDAYWEHGTIRFAFTPAAAAALRTDAFARVDGRRAAPLLGEAVVTDLDVRGVYRADIRDASGTPVGWLRVSVSPFDMPPRVYDGRIPATLTHQMIRTALARLDAEIDAIEARAADVHLCN